MMTVENLNFSYPCGRQILSDISFTAESGAFLAILGNNGAGKSTLLKCLDQILRPQSGVARIDGTDLLSLSPGELSRQVAFVTQGASSARLTVYEGVGHDCWLQAYHDPELYEWMLAQRKP